MDDSVLPISTLALLGINLVGRLIKQKLDGVGGVGGVDGVTRYMWHMTCDTWYLTHDMWPVTDGGGWTFSLNVSSLAHTVWD